jgi:hypothetical protein
MKSEKLNPVILICSICREVFDSKAPGAGIEVGTNRRFCPGCFADILTCSGIKPRDFLDDDTDEDEPKAIPFTVFDG